MMVLSVSGRKRCERTMGSLNSNPFHLALYFYLFFLCLVSGKVVDFSEKSQLLEMKTAIADPHNMLSSWKSSNHNHCSWFGVTCNSRARVSELRIQGGNFAHSASCLSNKYSDLQFHGFGIQRNCSSSKKGKFLGGKLSNVIGSFSELRVLSLPFNQIEGELPYTIWGLKNLEVIDIEGNSITGNIAMIDFANLKNLQVLNLGFNRLHGEIPNSIAQCEGLSTLSLSGNRFRGSISSFIGNFSNLKGIYLSYNRFTGPLADEFWVNCSVLEHIDFSSNLFNGEIPKSIGKCSRLKTLLLFSNAFNGALPSELGNLKFLEVLDVSRNRINGNLDDKLRVRCMKVFDVSGNLMSGSIPEFDYVSCPQFDRFSVHLSYFFRKTRIENENARAVFHDFSDNKFTGSIPLLPMISPVSKKIAYVFLAGGNKLVGGLFRENKSINCNDLNGFFVNVSNNALSGEIPTNVGEIWRCLKFLDASKNKISGPIPESIVSLSKLTVLLLDNNQLSGKIPSGLSNMKSLVKFNFSFNNLSRSLMVAPPVVLAVPSVPPEEPRAASIGSLESSVSRDSNGGKKKGFNSFELVLIVVASVIVLILVVLIIIYIYMKRRKSNSRIEGVSSSPTPRRSPPARREKIIIFKEVGVPLTFDTVVQATGNFTSRNCIGSGGFGSTYRAEISPGTTVAVKRLTIEMCQGVPQFNNEIRSLGRIRHPNLITLIGYYASSSEMFLIYNYLSGGNLEQFIRERHNREIDIKILHKIALNVAGALAFLHDQCSPRILHRDVKPSNILLDDDFNAYLSDFGLSRLLEGFETHVTTGVAGTFGYVAPEYALTCRASDKADVYSYGVMLLEMISDKRALDVSFSSQENGYTIVSWAAMLRREGRSEEVFAAGMWDVGPKDVLLELMNLGLICTADSVSVRPPMRQVVRKLKQIQLSLEC